MSQSVVVSQGPSSKMAEATRIANRITSDREYTVQLVEVISELQLDESEAKSYFNTLDVKIIGSEKQRLDLLREVMQYEGFSPRQMIGMLLRSHRQTAEDIESDPSALECVEGVMKGPRGELMNLRYTCNELFHQDIQFICLMFINRGASFDKIRLRSKELMVSVMDLLKQKYNINTAKRKPGATLDSKTITVPRIAACFPTVTVGLFHAGHGRAIFDATSVFGESHIPRALLSPMMASCVPRALREFRIVLLAISVATDTVLHSENQRTKLRQLLQFMDASFNSTAVTEVCKFKICKFWGVLKADGRPGDYLPEARRKAVEYVRKARVGDSDVESIIQEMTVN